MAAPTRKRSGDSRSNSAHKKARKAVPTEPEGKKTAQKLFNDFKSLDRCQVRDMGDEESLECYNKIRSEDLDWETTVGSAISDNISSVCERHGSQIKEFSAPNKKMTRRKSRGITLMGAPAPVQRPRSVTVKTEGGTGATFVSDIISETDLGTSKVNKLHGTTANDLLGQLRAIHNGMKMEANKLVLTYMNDDEKRRQVASDIKIDFPEGPPTTFTIEQLTLSKQPHHSPPE